MKAFHVSLKKILSLILGFVAVGFICWLILHSYIPDYECEVSVDDSQYPAIIQIQYKVPQRAKDHFSVKFGFSPNTIKLHSSKSQVNRNMYHFGRQTVSLYYKNRMLETFLLFLPTHGWITYNEINAPNLWFSKEVLRDNGILYNLPKGPDEKKTTHLVYADEFGNTSNGCRIAIDFKLIYSDHQTVLHKATMGFEFEHGMIDIGFVNPGFAQNTHLIVGKESSSGFYTDLRFLEVIGDKICHLELMTEGRYVQATWNGVVLFEQESNVDLGSFTAFNMNSKDTLAINNILLMTLAGDTLYHDDFIAPSNTEDE